MRLLLAGLRDLLVADPLVMPDTSHVRFVGYGTNSKEVEVFAYLRCEDEDAFLAAREEILLGIEEAIHEHGAGFSPAAGMA